MINDNAMSLFSLISFKTNTTTDKTPTIQKGAVVVSFIKPNNFESISIIVGSEKRKTYFFKGDNGCFVRAGCFFGTFDEFAAKVKETHGGTKFEREYLAALELAKIVLEVET